MNSQPFRFYGMAVHGVGMVNAIFRLWFFCMLLIVTMDLSHESFKHWNALNCVIRGPYLFVKTFARRSFRGSTKAYWIVLSTNIKPYTLRPSLMVNLEFWIPFAAPPFPISIWLSWLWYWAGGGGQGGVGSFCRYLLLWWGIHVLTHYTPIRMSGNISFCGMSDSSEISSVWSRRTRRCDV